MSSPDPPLNPETLDELLSADLDGEFERAAADLGFTVDEARAAMHATADTARRRAQLGAARDRLAIPIVLPPTIEQTLVSAALGGPVDELRAVRERRTRSWRVLVAAGSAVAVVAALLVVVVVFAATNHHGGVSTSASAVARPAHPSLPRLAAPLESQPVVEFGDVSRPATLRGGRGTAPARSAGLLGRDVVGRGRSDPHHRRGAQRRRTRRPGRDGAGGPGRTAGPARSAGIGRSAGTARR